MQVRRKRPPTTAAPQFLNERELVEPQKSLVFQVNNEDDNALTKTDKQVEIVTKCQVKHAAAAP